MQEAITVTLAILAVVGTLLGVRLQNQANSKRESENRAHENAVWIREHRQAAYSELLAAIHTLLIHHAPTKTFSNDDLSAMAVALATVELVGPDSVYQAGKQFAYILDELNGFDWATRVNSLRAAFVSAAREALSLP